MCLKLVKNIYKKYFSAIVVNDLNDYTFQQDLLTHFPNTKLKLSTFVFSLDSFLLTQPTL